MVNYHYLRDANVKHDIMSTITLLMLFDFITISFPYTIICPRLTINNKCLATKKKLKQKIYDEQQLYYFNNRL